MIRIIYFFKLLMILLPTVFLCLSSVKIAYIFSGVSVDMTIVYTITVLVCGILFLYEVYKKGSFIMDRNETHFIMTTVLTLRKDSNPFYNILIERLSPCYKIFIREFSFNSLLVIIFAGIFFLCDDLITKGAYSTTSDRNVIDSENNNVVKPSLTLNRDLVSREIRKISNIKALIARNGKKENIIEEIKGLEFIDNNKKKEMMGKVLDNKLKDVVDDLLQYVKSIKSSERHLSSTDNVTDEDIQKELTLLKNRTIDIKNNKKFRISSEYLQNWYGYEEVLKKYFNEQ